jgi:hypothetical protein
MPPRQRATLLATVTVIPLASGFQPGGNVQGDHTTYPKRISMLHTRAVKAKRLAHQ